jgi:toxin ParE1/3/4
LTRCFLSPRAAKDLDEIWDYTADRWGRPRAETYLRAIQAAIEAVAANPALSRACDNVRPGYRKYPAGTHIVFFRLIPEGIDVVRILHNRMDFDRHL